MKNAALQPVSKYVVSLQYPYVDGHPSNDKVVKINQTSLIGIEIDISMVPVPPSFSAYVNQ
jgi:hypothetical protein